MARKEIKDQRKMILGQSCDGKECRTKYKSEIIKNFSESICTPHEINFTTGKIKCLYCGKITKL